MIFNFNFNLLFVVLGYLISYLQIILSSVYDLLEVLRVQPTKSCRLHHKKLLQRETRLLQGTSLVT